MLVQDIIRIVVTGTHVHQKDFFNALYAKGVYLDPDDPHGQLSVEGYGIEEERNDWNAQLKPITTCKLVGALWQHAKPEYAVCIFHHLLRLGVVKKLFAEHIIITMSMQWSPLDNRFPLAEFTVKEIIPPFHDFELHITYKIYKLLIQGRHWDLMRYMLDHGGQEHLDDDESVVWIQPAVCSEDVKEMHALIAEYGMCFYIPPKQLGQLLCYPALLRSGKLEFSMCELCQAALRSQDVKIVDCYWDEIVDTLDAVGILNETRYHRENPTELLEYLKPRMVKCFPEAQVVVSRRHQFYMPLGDSFDLAINRAKLGEHSVAYNEMRAEVYDIHFGQPGEEQFKQGLPHFINAVRDGHLEYARWRIWRGLTDDDCFTTLIISDVDPQLTELVMSEEHNRFVMWCGGSHKEDNTILIQSLQLCLEDDAAKALIKKDLAVEQGFDQGWIGKYYSNVKLPFVDPKVLEVLVEHDVYPIEEAIDWALFADYKRHYTAEHIMELFEAIRFFNHEPKRILNLLCGMHFHQRQDVCALLCKRFPYICGRNLEECRAICQRESPCTIS